MGRGPGVGIQPSQQDARQQPGVRGDSTWQSLLDSPAKQPRAADAASSTVQHAASRTLNCFPWQRPQPRRTWMTCRPSTLPAAVCSRYSPCGTASTSSMPTTVTGLTQNCRAGGGRAGHVSQRGGPGRERINGGAGVVCTNQADASRRCWQTQQSSSICLPMSRQQECRVQHPGTVGLQAPGSQARCSLAGHASPPALPHHR